MSSMLRIQTIQSPRRQSVVAAMLDRIVAAIAVRLPLAIDLSAAEATSTAAVVDDIPLTYCFPSTGVSPFEIYVASTRYR